MIRNLSITALVACLAAFLVGCGDEPDGAVTSDNVVDVSGTADGTVIDNDTGTAATDSGAAADSTGPLDTGATAGDAGSTTGKDVENDCPGGPGCVCTANGDCDTSICLSLSQGKECAKKCVDTCADGWKCTPVSAGGGDTVNICVPTREWLCDPCSASTTCKGLGVDDAACVDYGVDGAFCGVACKDDAGCPTDYTCKAAQTVEGAPTKQCVRKDAKGAPFGPCTCSDAAKTKQLKTACVIEHKDSKGQLVGKCPGTRTCAKDGLSTCIGPPPDTEVCDGEDNDCDGKIDEATCDDKNVCTLDVCDTNPGAGAKKGCVHKKLHGQPCDADGSACTEKDACDTGICVPGAPKNCDDGNGCTTDACLPASGCTQTNDEGKGCEADGNPCTAGDQCLGGACKAGKLKECASGDACIAGKCSPASGKCEFKELTASCDDGNPCTAKDACKDGFCTGDPASCDDNNTCTTDACKKDSGCVHSPSKAPCDDGSACTLQDTCAKTKCVGLPLTATDCDDNNPCTTEGCDPKATGKGKLAGCTHQDNTATCDDGNACTTNDTCKASKCVSGANVCACTPAVGNTPDSCQNKDDGNACNGIVRCLKSGTLFQCQIVPGSPITCDKTKDDACRRNTCAPKSGICSLLPINAGKPCDADGSVCTAKDACQAGTCVKGAAIVCNDKNPCTTDSCDAKKGCVYVANNSPCNADDNACTPTDACKNKVCLAGPAKKCHDGNDCTADKCDPKTGKCGYVGAALDGKACNADSSVCTQKDTCKGGTCNAGKQLVCDDNKPCTADSCDAKKGCVHTAKTGPCSDNNPCTVGDSCAAGVCKPGKNTCACLKDSDCAQQEDGDLCNGTLRCEKAKAPYICVVDKKTIVTCSGANDTACVKAACAPKTGKCGPQNVTKGASCDDGNACTSGDSCGANNLGKFGCLAGKKVSCKDGNPCTSDVCDVKKGCTQAVDTSVKAPCYSGDKATRDVGTCKGGFKACQASGSFGACVGEVVPAKQEACDGKDDDCDGKTDLGCSATGFAFAEVGVAVDGTTKAGVGVKARGSNVAGSAASSGTSATFGWLAWLKRALK